MEFSIVLALLFGIVIGFIIGKLIGKIQSSETTIDNSSVELKKNIAILEERVKISKEENERIQADLGKEREQLGFANNRLAKAEEAFKNMQEKFDTQEDRMKKMEEEFTIKFQNIANKILKQNSQDFADSNEKRLKEILSPLKEKISSFEEKVEKKYLDETKERSSLKQQIEELTKLNQSISEEAHNLTKALKGDNKTQGNWGEFILEKVLENSGLIKGEEYKTQEATTNEEGRRLQPDVVIMLPENKHIIVDSKVSLIAYEGYVNSEDETERDQHLKNHIISVKTHIKSLSEKNYQTGDNFNSPDFVLLFIPIESSFSLALQADNELYSYAWDRKVVIVSPSTLLATLRTVSSLWKQEKQTKNALEIARQAGNLYDKFVGFLEDMDQINKSIKGAQRSYDQAINKLSTGSGNLIGRTQKIKELGIKTTKNIPDSFDLEDNTALNSSEDE